MEPIYYMEYSESFKIVNEMYTALYKFTILHNLICK